MDRNYNSSKPLCPEAQEAARKWNAFTEPLRRKYGIPKWKPEAEQDHKKKPV